jgi:hypothetical protein
MAVKMAVYAIDSQNTRASLSIFTTDHYLHLMSSPVNKVFVESVRRNFLLYSLTHMDTSSPRFSFVLFFFCAETILKMH